MAHGTRTRTRTISKIKTKMMMYEYRMLPNTVPNISKGKHKMYRTKKELGSRIGP